MTQNLLATNWEKFRLALVVNTILFCTTLTILACLFKWVPNIGFLFAGELRYFPYGNVQRLLTWAFFVIIIRTPLMAYCNTELRR